jgi:hypothetical protein
MKTPILDTNLLDDFNLLKESSLSYVPVIAGCMLFNP